MIIFSKSILKFTFISYIFVTNLYCQSPIQYRNSFVSTLSPLTYVDKYLGIGVDFAYIRNFKKFQSRLQFSGGYAHGNHFGYLEHFSLKGGTYSYSTDIVLEDIDYLVDGSVKENSKFYINQAIKTLPSNKDNYSYFGISGLLGFPKNLKRKLHVIPWIGIKLGIAQYTDTYEIDPFSPSPGVFYSVYTQVHGKYLFWGLEGRIDVSYDIRPNITLGTALDINTHKYYINDFGNKFVHLGIFSEFKF